LSVAWLQLRLHSPAAETERWEDVLLAAGAEAVTYLDAADQPVLEPGVGQMPLWDQVVLLGLFPAAIDTAPVLDRLRVQTGDATLRFEILEDKDWEREWMQHYQPMRFGARLWICPTWQSPPQPDAITVLLDPGLAFGTGTHPTTAMCLEALAGMDLLGKTVVDYGCGSGILAIAAAKLGARRVVAVDNDPQALTACRANAERNGISAELLSVHLPEATPGVQANVVIANILAGPLKALSATLLGLLAPRGELLMAGLLESQAQNLIQHYATNVALRAREQREEWVCLSGRRSEN